MRNALLKFSFVLALIAAAMVEVARAAPITVSAAVSLKESLTDAAERYAKQYGEKVDLNFGATGHLLAQIREGAPVDVFVAASEQQMDQAAEWIDPKTRTVIAGNRLVLIAAKEASLSKVTSFMHLGDPRVKRLAIGQPRTVPAGQYAAQVLARLKLESTLADRMVYGSSVRQVLDYVERGEVEAGIVYATDARQAGDAVRVIATADDSWHDPIRYVAATVSASANADPASRFIEFLKSEEVQKAFASRGFVPAATAVTGAATTTSAKPDAAR